MTGDSRPRLSVLVVNYNGGDVLLESLIKLQEVIPSSRATARAAPSKASTVETLTVETIVADNGSQDGSLSRIRQEAPQVRVLELDQNLGFGAANNRAAAAAQGELLLLLNSDAWPLPGSLEAMVAALDADPRLGLIAPRLVYPDGRPQFHWAPTTSVFGEAVQMARNRFEHHRWVHRRFPGRGWFTAACMLLRRGAFEQIGGFDESFFLYFEDVDLCLRLRAAGWRLGEAPQAVAVHVKGGSQPTGQSELHYRKGQLLYYQRHRPAWETAFLRRKLQRKFSALEEPARSKMLALL